MSYADDERALLDQLNTRGVWRFVFRPQSFGKRVTDVLSVFEMVERARVDFRSWPYPFVPAGDHLKHGARNTTMEWAGQWHTWEHRREVWRCFTTGQFSSLNGVAWDWRDESGWWPAAQTPGWQPNTQIPLSDVVFSIVERVEFAARLADTALGDERLHLELVLENCQGRELFSDYTNRAPLLPGYHAKTEQIPIALNLSKAELAASADGIAVDTIGRVVAQFGWKPEPSTVRSLVDEVKRRV
jgi:hypothetical protein